MPGKYMNLSRDTQAILKAGKYINKRGTKVSIREQLELAVQGSCLLQPGTPISITAPKHPKVGVIGCSTIQAIQNWTGMGRPNIGALVFGSAHSPGGGFLTGAMAQEESIAYSSGLYPCSLAVQDYYTFNSKSTPGIYCDNGIASRDVPVFRDTNYESLFQPVMCSFLTVPAINYSRVSHSEANDGIMQARITHILEYFVRMGCKNLILGAFGCGVFKNDPHTVASMFRNSLESRDWDFNEITFAILDNSRTSETKQAFITVFKGF